MDVPKVIRDRLEWVKVEIASLENQLALLKDECEGLEVARDAILDFNAEWEPGKSGQIHEVSQPTAIPVTEYITDVKLQFPERIRDRILAVTDETPLTAIQIADRLGLRARQVVPRLSVLAQEGLLRHEGNTWSRLNEQG